MTDSDGRLRTLPEYPSPKKWWQNPKWLMALAALIFAFANVTVAATSYATRQTQTERIAVGDRTASLVEDMATVVERLDSNQAGIDELVAFVRDVQIQQAEGAQTTEAFINNLVTLLCASEDPIRTAACTQLGYLPGG